MMAQWILAGDVGGTKINIGIFAHSAAGLWLAHEATYATQETAGLSEVVADFLKQHDDPVATACFGVAGPVEEGRASMVNVPWGIDARELAARCHFPKVELINDLVATGYGINQLSRDAVLVLNKGVSSPTGNGALLAAGTGLGKAVLLRTRSGWQPLPSEGGHADFAPVDDEQIELMRYLRRRHGGCDIERVLSGRGLVSIYQFYRDTRRIAPPAELDGRIVQDGDDAARFISEAGLSGEIEIAVRALEVFVDVYAAGAGNFALECLATGGVWLGGGIAPKILAALQQPRFMQAFLNRDRLRELLENVPVQVILEPKTALLGAAHHAVQMLESQG